MNARNNQLLATQQASKLTSQQERIRGPKRRKQERYVMTRRRREDGWATMINRFPRRITARLLLAARNARCHRPLFLPSGALQHRPGAPPASSASSASASTSSSSTPSERSGEGVLLGTGSSSSGSSSGSNDTGGDNEQKHQAHSSDEHGLHLRLAVGRSVVRNGLGSRVAPREV
eukprot:CAMPEP_0167796432 /NCGR_PEP_ID=MMETSP0111_2-20121227/15038_1 /TAXON_ID=91324 /ORGANISM="Lotharella globosa, Strain CCCM811" /LENGTH=174 /DNA_ID=CAMNT_0007690311 /DNA_START=671 /DNA_END=1196 /DNA_ORIENTATION=+